MNADNMNDDVQHSAAPAAPLPLPDIIIAATHHFIQAERRRSFSFLGRHRHYYLDQNDLLVVSRADKDDMKPIRESDRKARRLASFSNKDWFTFYEPIGLGTSRTVAITISPGCQPAIENMQVTVPLRNDAPSTLPATTWIRDTYNWTDNGRMKFSAEEYEEQQLWWTGSSQTFRLFDLPLELRENIYLHIIGPVVVPTVYQGTIVLGAGLTSPRPISVAKMNRDPDIPAPNMTIMRVSSAVKREATTVAHRDTFKRIRFVGPAAPLTPQLMTLKPPHAAFLRNLQLEMSASAYFAFAGMLPSTPQTSSSFSIASLRSCTALQRLDLRFISPKHPDAACPRNPTSAGHHACQKVWIEWFFVLAFPALMALSSAGRNVRVSLSGCVKTSTKAKWEFWLNDKREDCREEMQSLRKMMRERMGGGEVPETSGTVGAGVGVAGGVAGGATDSGAGGTGSAVASGLAGLSNFPCKCRSLCEKGDEAMNRFRWSEHEIRMIEGLQGVLDDGYWDFED
jgi:hypothetical protein